jgi:hypothetical protein
MMAPKIARPEPSSVAGPSRNPPRLSARQNVDGSVEQSTRRSPSRSSWSFAEVPVLAPMGNVADTLEHEADRSSGKALDPATRAFFEPRFGHDLGGVRVHADQPAGDLVRRLGARAATIGRKIFFAPGEFQPGRMGGKRLLAHELTHVVQQARLAKPMVQRATHTGAADYFDPDNCWATPDRPPTDRVLGRIEGILEVPGSCKGTIRMTSRFTAVGDWSIPFWLGDTGSGVRFTVSPIGVGEGQLTSEKSVSEHSFENVVTYPLTSATCPTNFAAYVLMTWFRNGPKNFFEVKFAPSTHAAGGRLTDTSATPEVRVDSCGRLQPTPTERPQPLPPPYGTQPEP